MSRHGKWPVASGFGALLKKEREAKGLSQNILAERAGVHQQTITKLELGSQEPAWPLVLALAKALGIDVNKFVPTEEPVPLEAPRRGRPVTAGR